MGYGIAPNAPRKPQRPSPKSMRATGTPSDKWKARFGAQCSSEAPANLTEKHAWRPVPQEMNGRYGYGAQSSSEAPATLTEKHTWRPVPRER